jgi:hypothetical protein
VEFVKVGVDVVKGVLLDADGPDVLVLNLLHHLDRVLDGRLDGGQQGA